MSPAYLRTPAALERYGIGRTTLWRWVQAGRIPAPVRLAGSPLLFWSVAELEAWEVEAKSAA